MSNTYLRRAVYLVVGCCLAIVFIFVLDTINTSIQYNRIERIVQKSFEERDLPIRFKLIATDGVHAEFDFNGKMYPNLMRVQSLDGEPASSIAVLLCMSETSTVHVIKPAYSHFSSLGVNNFYFEYACKEYQRIELDEKRMNNEVSLDNELVIYGEDVLYSGRKYRLDGESANDLQQECDSNSAPVDILCSGETPCGYLMKLIGILHLEPHRKLYLHILQANAKD